LGIKAEHVIIRCGQILSEINFPHPSLFQNHFNAQGSGVLKGHFMRTNSIYRVVVLLIVATLVLTSCKVPGPTPQASTEANNPEALGATATQTLIDEVAVATEEPTPTAPAPTPIPIVDNRLPPERWRNGRSSQS